MALKNRGRTLAAGLLAGVLVGGGFAMVTPAGAAVKEAASAINWKNIWQTEIRPRADKRYFTKKKANARFYTKIQTTSIFESKVAHDASLLNYYTKAESDANYYTKAQSDANYYTKAQSDAKYAPYPTLMRGVYQFTTTSSAAGESAGGDISFGVTLTAAPTAHYILIGDAPPAGCSGTPAAPNAQAGHLCIFESYTFGSLSGVATRGVVNITGGGGTAVNIGAGVYGFTNGAGNGRVIGTWAMRPATLAPPGFQGPNVQPSGGPSIDQ